MSGPQWLIFLGGSTIGAGVVLLVLSVRGILSELRAKR